MSSKKQQKPCLTTDTKNYCRRGLITVEAALVVPVIVGVLVLFYSLAMIEYQNIVARAQAMRAASRVAQNWNMLGGEYTILLEDTKEVVFSTDVAASEEGGDAEASEEDSKKGKTGKNAIESASYSNHDPYRFLFGLSGKRAENTQKYISRSMEEVGKLDIGISAETDAALDGSTMRNPFNRYISVSVNNTYASPMIEFLNNMGYSVKKDYTITAKARLTEPAEFVRNVSYIFEMVRKLKK